jgi:hypothetical protein
VVAIYSKLLSRRRRVPASKAAGLRNLQRRVLPEATVVLDWLNIAMRFEHVLQAAIGLGVGTVDAHLGEPSRCDIKHAKWPLERPLDGLPG